MPDWPWNSKCLYLTLRIFSKCLLKHFKGLGSGFDTGMLLKVVSHRKDCRTFPTQCYEILRNSSTLVDSMEPIERLTQKTGYQWALVAYTLNSTITACTVCELTNATLYIMLYTWLVNICACKCSNCWQEINSFPVALWI